ncbi:MAG: flagellar basal body-associated FliL family protein [Candidatus Riflebacteria bacterium]|nr:flagellar basal body-associated FliL family protein [Candidatus Riflebacteria bacterium]
MSTKIRTLLAVIAVIVVILIVVGLVFKASKKGRSGGTSEVKTETATGTETTEGHSGEEKKTDKPEEGHGSATNTEDKTATKPPEEKKEPTEHEGEHATEHPPEQASEHGSPPPAHSEGSSGHGSGEKKPGDVGRFQLGEFTAPARDEEVHYIKIEVELEFTGDLEKELTERKNELRDSVTTIIMKLTIQRAKEDYIDRFLHQEILNKLNEILGLTGNKKRILKIFIPSFLVN